VCVAAAPGGLTATPTSGSTELLRRGSIGIEETVAVFRPFPITSAKGKPHQGTAQAVDIAARYFVYKLFDATNRQPGAWAVLGDIGEAKATAVRAVQRGWIVVREDGVNGRRKAQSAALTDEGRLVARKGLRG
jgi:hypothetical protein